MVLTGDLFRFIGGWFSRGTAGGLFVGFNGGGGGGVLVY